MKRVYLKRSPISQEELLDRLKYIPETGDFFWVNCVRAHRNGFAAGSVDKKSGHKFIRINDVSLPASRLAWLAVHGSLPDRPLRFLDENPLNLRITNLSILKARPKSELNMRKSEDSKAHRKAFPDYHREMKLKKTFGISVAEYQKMFVEQNGCCAICEKPETKTRGGQVKWLAVDHDHSTGEIRGLLCQSCNMGVGHFNDDIPTLSRAISYLGRKRNSDNVVRLVRNSDA